VLALYLNSFVAVVQSFLKVPALRAFAPTQKEPPFLVAQLIVMALFIVLATFGVKKFHVGGLLQPDQRRTASSFEERSHTCRGS
jgi:hypothetical protein